jgi:hypothetical protein
LTGPTGPDSSGSAIFITVDPTVHTAAFTLTANILSLGGTVGGAPEDALATLPLAASVPNGTVIGLFVTSETETWLMGTQGGDTFGNGAGLLSVPDSGGFVYVISDGTSVWYQLSTS